MARHQYFFGDHLTTGKAIGSFKGFADDFEKVKYILEHLDADDPIELGRGNDGSITIRFNPNASGGGSSYTPPASANGIQLNSNGTASVVHVYAQADCDTAVAGTDTVITAPEVYLELTHDAESGTPSLAVVCYASGSAPSPTDYKHYVRLYTMADDLVTITVDWRTAPQFTIYTEGA